MNKACVLTFLSCSLMGGFAHSKTVQDVINLIEKKQNKIPSYQSELKRQRGRVNLRIERPSSNFSLIFPEGTAEREYEQSLNKEITQLNYLSKKLKNPRTKQNIWMRLAKAYSEKAALVERREQDTYDKRLKMYLSGSINQKPVLSLKGSKAYNKKAVSLYNYYLKTYPKARDIDQVLFFLGYNYMSLGQAKEANKYYKQLSANFPRSDYVNEANLSLGDYYFEQDRRSSAKTYYERVVRSRSQLKNLALYKLAWVNRKIGNHDQALKNILRVIQYSKKSGSRNKRDIALGKEAKKDLPMFYAEAGDPRRALTYFTNIMSRKDAGKAIEKLAYYYVDKGDRAEARYLFGQLIRLNPDDDKSFDYQYSLVTMQAATGRQDLYERELYTWVKEFGPGSVWARSTKDKAKVKESFKKAESLLRSYVLKIHNEARASQSKAKLARAEKGYDIYLKSFGSGPYGAEMRFYSAELLYELGLYKQAYTAYQSVKDVKYKKKAQLNAVLSLEKTIPSDREIRERVGSSTKVLPLSPNEKVFVDAAKKYLESPENQEQRVEIEYRVASIYYSHNYFDESEVIFKSIVKNHPGTKYAKFSSDLILDSYKLKKDYAGLERAGKELVSLGGNVDVRGVKSLVEKSAFKKAETLAKSSKDTQAVAAAFIGFVSTYPQSSLASEAYYNAGINYEKAGDLKKALSAYEMVSSSKPELYREAARFSAFIYEKIGYLDKASRLYERLGDTNKISAIDRKKFLSNASVIREAFNDVSGMKRVFGKLGKFDSERKRSLYDYRLSQVHQRIGNTNESLKYKIKFFNTSKAEPFLLVKTAKEIGDVYKDKKDISKAQYWYKASSLVYQKFKNKGAKAASADAARAEFELSNKIFEDFLAVEIPKDVNKQSQAITKKLGLIEKLNEKMVKVINYDDGYSIVAALSRQGQAYQHLTFSILNTPLPKTLSTEERDQYNKILLEKAAPLKKNAITSYKKAIEKGLELRTFNSEYLSALFELSKMDSSYSKYSIPMLVENFEAKASISQEKSFGEQIQDEALVLQKYSNVLVAKDADKDEAHYALADFYHSKGLSGVSNLFLDKVSSKGQKTARHFNLKGLNRLLENNIRLAATDFKKALTYNARYIPSVNNLSGLYMQFGGYKSAGELMSKVYPLGLDTLGSKDKFRASNNYAAYLALEGRVDESMSYFKSIAKGNPLLKSAIGNATIVALNFQRNKKRGLQYLSQYKKLAKSPGDFDRIRMLESVQL